MTELFQNVQSVYRKWEEKANPKTSSIYSGEAATFTKTSDNDDGLVESDDMTVQQNNQENQRRSVADPVRRVSVENPDDRRQRRISNGNGGAFLANRMPSTRSRFRIPNLPQWDRIAHFKVSPSLPEMNPKRPSMGICCSSCVPTSRLAFGEEPSSTLGISNVLNVPTQNRENGIVTRTFYHLAFLVRRGVYYPYPDVSGKVLKSERVLEALDLAVEDEIKGEGLNPKDIDPEIQEALKRKHYGRAVEGLQRMRSCISSILLRLAGWVLYKLLGRMLTGIQVHKGQIENIKRIGKRNLPIIYLPLHRSHLDYILVTFILYINDLQAPIIAAGDNLLIPFFGALMRGLGAFFIKRKMDSQKGKKDHVYRAILQEYMMESLKAGHSLEFFIEGGRSRTGKACMPKAGLLSVVVDSVLTGVVEDAFIVPVGISYEKILDGNFVMEQLGKPKVMENFSSAVRAIWRTLHSNFGNVRVDFCQPYSLKEFINSSKRRHSTVQPPIFTSNGSNGFKGHVRRKSSTSSLYGLDCVRNDSREIIKDLAYHVVHDASNSTALMSTNLLAFLLLTKHRKGATLQQLSQSMTWLKEELSSRKRDVGFTGESADVVKHAWSLVGKELITTETIEMEWSSIDSEASKAKITFYKPVIRLPYILELQYYANSVISPFLIDSVVVNALLTQLDEELNPWRGCRSQVTVSLNAVVEKSLELCDLLQYEFVFAPACTDLSSVIIDKVGQLIGEELLSATGDVSSRNTQNRSWSNRMEGLASDEDEEDGLILPRDQILKVNLTEESLNRIEFLRCILSPLIESYWVVACSLVKLINIEKEESLFFGEIHKTAEERLHKGLLAYEESFAAEPLKNSLKLFEHWNVLENHIQDSVKLVYLQSSFNSEESLQGVVTRVQQFRK